MRTPLDVAIIGAGFSGLCMGIHLRKAGQDNFVILEKGEDVGGVWRANTYPGACCDIPANLYSFSFEMKTDWSRRYPPQAEIQQYMRDLARKYELYPRLRTGTEVEDADYDEARALWRVRLAGGETIEARALVSGVGQLSRPAFPRIAGIEQFRGKLFHSAEWDHAHDLTGRTVAVVGTGASAIQFIPPTAEKVRQMYVIQRTPPYIVPKPDEVYTAFHRFLFRYIPGFQRLYRALWYNIGERSCGAFDNLDSWLAKFFRSIALWHMRRHVKDEALRAKLTPDYPIGCKRVLFASNYFEALARPNVEVLTEEIAGATERGLRLASGRELVVDTIIYGTGFRASEFLSPMRITGRGGVSLNDAWREGAQAYLGITVSGFPNFFMLYGPNTNLGSNSIIFMIECQTRYIMGCLEALQSKNLKSLDVRPERLRHFNDELQAKLRRSVWSAGCHSWYHNEAGRITNNWPGYTQDYRRLTTAVNLADYDLVAA